MRRMALRYGKVHMNKRGKGADTFKMRMGGNGDNEEGRRGRVRDERLFLFSAASSNSQAVLETGLFPLATLPVSFCLWPFFWQERAKGSWYTAVFTASALSRIAIHVLYRSQLLQPALQLPALGHHPPGPAYFPPLGFLIFSCR